jgi:hypothetical protein
MCEDLKISRGFPVKRFLSFGVFQLKLVKSIKNCRKIQYSTKVYIFLSFSFCLKNTNVKYLDL